MSDQYNNYSDSSDQPPMAGRPVHPLEQPPPLPEEVTGPPQPLPRVTMPSSIPAWTYVLLAVNALVFLADSATQWLGLDYTGMGLLTLMGAKSNDAIMAGEFWRLVTPLFLHGGIVHLGVNSYFLFIVGRQIERAYGPLRFLAIYLISGIAGVLASFMLSPYASIGASGALFGIIGAWIPLLYRNRFILKNPNRQIWRIVQIIAINLLIGLTPGIDNWAHVGGLLGGLALGWVVTPRYVVRLVSPADVQVEDESSQTTVLLAISGAVLCLGMLTAAGIAMRTLLGAR